MKQRNVAAVLILTLFTFGIYGIVWSVKTKNEMNKLGAQIPTAWLIIIPFVNLWWMWKYSEGVEKVTGGKLSTVMCFVLWFLLGIIGQMIIQYEFNKMGSTPAVATGDPNAPSAMPPASGPVNNEMPQTPPQPEMPPAPGPVPPVSTPPTPEMPPTAPAAMPPAPAEQPPTNLTPGV
jgi:hypothetical protein